MSLPRAPIGVVIAGGRGRRLGGAKPTAELVGRALISYPLEALQAVLAEVVVVAKADSPLPRPLGVPLWEEPQTPSHPLVGIVTALQRAQGRSVLVCGCDFPLVSPATVRALAEDPRKADAILTRADGRRQPLVGCYRPNAVHYLAEELRKKPDRSVQMIVTALTWEPLDVAPLELFNVNTPMELAGAAARIRGY